MNYQNSMPDEQLIRFYLNGNPNAMATLVALYKDRIYSTIFAIVQDKYVAEEIFREVFIRIIDNLLAGKTTEEGNFLQWALRIAQSLCLEHSRKSRIQVVLPADNDDTITASELAAPGLLPDQLYYENHDKIKSLIDMLPEEQREVMVLNHYAGLSLKEITGVMKCSLTTALDTMKIGLNNLRKLMTEKEVVIN